MDATLYQQQPKEVTITWRFCSINTATTNTMLILIIMIIMSKIQFLLHIHKKDLFLLPTPTEVGFNTTNSLRFYSSSNPSQPNHSSLVRTTKCGILLSHRTEDSPYQNLRANPCFLLSGSDPLIAELEFWLASHWAPHLSAPNFTKKFLISEELADLRSGLRRVALGYLWLSPAVLSSRPRIYGNCGYFTSAAR